MRQWPAATMSTTNKVGFIRVKLLQCERGDNHDTSDETFDPYVAVNVKEAHSTPSKQSCWFPHYLLSVYNPSDISYCRWVIPMYPVFMGRTPAFDYDPGEYLEHDTCVDNIMIWLDRHWGVGLWWDYRKTPNLSRGLN